VKTGVAAAPQCLHTSRCWSHWWIFTKQEDFLEVLLFEHSCCCFSFYPKSQSHFAFTCVL